MRQGATDRWWENPSPAGGRLPCGEAARALQGFVSRAARRRRVTSSSPTRTARSPSASRAGSARHEQLDVPRLAGSCGRAARRRELARTGSAPTRRILSSARWGSTAATTDRCATRTSPGSAARRVERDPADLPRDGLEGLGRDHDRRLPSPPALRGACGDRTRPSSTPGGSSPRSSGPTSGRSAPMPARSCSSSPRCREARSTIASSRRRWPRSWRRLPAGFRWSFELRNDYLLEPALGRHVPRARRRPRLHVLDGDAAHPDAARAPGVVKAAPFVVAASCSRASRATRRRRPSTRRSIASSGSSPRCATTSSRSSAPRPPRRGGGVRPREQQGRGLGAAHDQGRSRSASPASCRLRANGVR